MPPSDPEPFGVPAAVTEEQAEHAMLLDLSRRFTAARDHSFMATRMPAEGRAVQLVLERAGRGVAAALFSASPTTP